ncbi:MAG: ABC transporter substrate-binding protein [bacterium]|nr:ABC transporter substrate-binding protein [bacterium]
MSRFLRAVAPVITALVLACSATAYAAGLRVGSDISYAPLEFYGAGHAMQGFDIDLARAIATKIGEPVEISNHTFDDLIPSVQKGTFDFAISALSDTRAREAKVDFVDYLLAGSGMLVPAGNPHHVFNLGALCGLRVDVQRGTSQEAAIVDQSKRCTAVHLGAIHISSFSTDSDGFKAFSQGKSDVHITDFPVVAYLAKSSGGKYEVAGRQFALVPYGIAVAKGNTVLRARIVAALASVIADGSYDALLKKWGLEQGALRSVPVNAGTLFEGTK